MGKAHLSSFWTKERQQAYNHWYYLHKKKKKNQETFFGNAQDFIDRIIHEPYLDNLKHNYELGKKAIDKVLKVYGELNAKSEIETRQKQNEIWTTNPTYSNPNKVRPYSPNNFNTYTYDDATNWDDF